MRSIQLNLQCPVQNYYNFYLIRHLDILIKDDFGRFGNQIWGLKIRLLQFNVI